MTDDTTTPPNFLVIMVDQLSYPRKNDGSNDGFLDDLKAVLSFVDPLNNNSYAKYFPGFCKLREYAVVLTNHTIAESACIPSRASIMTGQYGPRTGVTQTDGLFKSGEAQNFPWLRANGVPTMGDWFRGLGYSTHYFGKWHVSDPPEHTLEGFGFADWELSWPEPHGSSVNNLGMYRDYQFADLACGFLMARGLGVPYNRASAEQLVKTPLSDKPVVTKPFFAVVSFTNPHDIATYPALPRALKPSSTENPWTPESAFGPGGSVPVPALNTLSAPPTQGSFCIPLNPLGFPQDCANPSLSQNENLWTNNKPRAQYDYAIKCGLGLAAKTGLSVSKSGKVPDTMDAAVQATLAVAMPFQLQEDPDGAALGFLQYYGYMISVVDRHILNVLTTLEKSGLRNNTVVAFISDHGEYGAAHSMMIEKWHTAYQETVHVPVLFSAPSLNPSTDTPVAISALTSHIDILPTLLGLANADPDTLNDIRNQLSLTHSVPQLPGANLKPLLENTANVVVGPDQQERDSVLFVTDDMITEPLPKDADPHNQQSWQQYEVYLNAVDYLRNPNIEKPERFNWPQLAPGPVLQPAHVRALRMGDWKLVRYCDPWSQHPVPDEWELYNLAVDSTEMMNLLVYNGNFPTPIASLPPSLAGTDIAAIAQQMREILAKKETELLSPYPSLHPSAGHEGWR